MLFIFNANVWENGLSHNKVTILNRLSVLSMTVICLWHMIFLIAMVFVLLPVIGCWVASLEIQMVLPLFLLSVLLIGLPLFGLDQCDSTPIGLFCFYSVYPAQMDLLTAGCS